MKILLAATAAVLLLGFAAVSQSDTSTESSDGSQSTQVASDVTYSDVVSAANDNPGAFLDVRTPAEYSESHFEGAELLPLQDIQAGALPDVDTDTTVYVYCRSGNRSAQATRILENAGYSVVDLGGLPDVTAMGGKLTTDTGQRLTQ